MKIRVHMLKKKKHTRKYNPALIMPKMENKLSCACVLIAKTNLHTKSHLNGSILGKAGNL